VLRLLGVRRGVVALNKIDLVDAEWADLVAEEIGELVRGTFLEGAPVVRVSAHSGEGVEDLGRALRDLLVETVAPRAGGLLRLPVDRAFQVKGFGAVCTGTVLSGRLRRGDAVELLPAGRRLRVRGLQRHGADVAEVAAGDRAAANLAGSEVAEAERGHVLAAPGALRPTHMLDVSLELLGSAPAELSQRTRVRLHMGTSEVLGRVVLLDRGALAPGQRGVAQLRLEAPVVSCWGDRFVVRRYSPAITIGGGRVLAVHPGPRRPGDAAAGLLLAALDVEAPAAALEPRLALEPTGCLPAPQLAGELGLTGEGLAATLDPLRAEGRVVEVEAEGAVQLFHGPAWQYLTVRLEAELGSFHREHPEALGMSREDLRRAVSRALPAGLFDAVLARLEQEGHLLVEGAVVRTPGHEIELGPQQAVLAARLEEALKGAGLESPITRASLAELGRGGAEAGTPDAGPVSAVLTALTNLGAVLVLEGDLLLHRDDFGRLRQSLVAHLESRGEITVSQFRELIGSNRRYALALLNRFDGEGLTERRGDVRVLR
ncbi:SelB C-terminal domain-containing protein, partial [Candidatus Latescibacterota bacterium]